MDFLVDKSKNKWTSSNIKKKVRSTLQTWSIATSIQSLLCVSVVVCEWAQRMRLHVRISYTQSKDFVCICSSAQWVLIRIATFHRSIVYHTCGNKNEYNRSSHTQQKCMAIVDNNNNNNIIWSCQPRNVVRETCARFTVSSMNSSRFGLFFFWFYCACVSVCLGSVCSKNTKAKKKNQKSLRKCRSGSNRNTSD